MLTPDQARALWDAGGFALLQGLPAGSDAGIDGTYHAVRAFAGHKFVPPGFHLLVWGAVPREAGGQEGGTENEKCEEGVEEIATPGAEAAAAAAASTSARDLAAAFPVRSAYAHHFSPRERLAITYDAGSEKATLALVPDAALPALDPMLAPYPFAGLEGWKTLSAAISAAVVRRVTGGNVVDSLTPEAGGSDDLAVLREAARRAYDSSAGDEDEFKLQFPVFELKRSAPAGAAGDALSRWSRDKSALLARVCAEVGGPRALLGHAQLAFLLVTQVWNFAALGAYKRLVGLLCRSPAALASPSDAELDLPAAEMRETALAFLHTLGVQIAALPDSAESEIPDLDKFFSAELEQLRRALGAAMAEREWWALAPQVAAAWGGLQREARKRGWELEDVPAGDEDSDEEGEYAPVVVETENV